MSVDSFQFGFHHTESEIIYPPSYDLIKLLESVVDAYAPIATA